MEHQGRDDDCCEAESFHWAWLHPLSLLNGTSRAADPTWRVIAFHRLIAMKMLIAKKRVLARYSHRLAGPELEVGRGGRSGAAQAAAALPAPIHLPGLTVQELE